MCAFTVRHRTQKSGCVLELFFKSSIRDHWRTPGVKAPKSEAAYRIAKGLFWTRSHANRQVWYLHPPRMSSMTHNRPRVLHLMDGLQIGGRQRVVLDLIRRANALGNGHGLLLFDSPFRDEAIDFRAGEFQVYFEKRKPGFDWTLPRRIARFLRSGSYDVVHAHNDTAIFYAAIAVAGGSRTSRELVGTFHTMPASTRRIGRACINLAGRQAFELTAVSSEMANRLFTAGWTYRLPQTIWNGVDLEQFSPGPDLGWREKLGLSESAVVIGHVGRFCEVKRQRDLLVAFRTVARSEPSCRLIFVGQGELLEAIKSEANSPAIQFLPSTHDMAAFLRAIDIFVLCSDHEGCPCAMLEAMACGLAIVATSVGGVPQILTTAGDVLAGRVVPPRAPDKLASAVLELVSRPDLRKALGRAARLRARDFSLDRQWKEYARLYESAGAR